MLDPKKTECINTVQIVGILNELDVVEGKTGDGRDYVRGTATIRVDQEINGEMVENTIPVSMFSMKKKSDGTPNPNYERILNYKKELVAAGAVDDIADASRVYVGGKSASIDENMFVNKQGKLVSTPQISSNFINKSRKDEEDSARFEMVGVVGKIRPEVDKEGEETGRLIVSFITFGYNGKANVIDLIAEDMIDCNAKTFIDSHWEEGDTVSVGGIIKMSYKTLEWEEEQGFGKPIKRHKTVSSRELLIDQGAGEGFEESLSYDADLVRVALDERETYKQSVIDKANSSNKTTAKSEKKKGGFGF